jgi:DNA-binding beta-propeller fold protein YncE
LGLWRRLSILNNFEEGTLKIDCLRCLLWSIVCFTIAGCGVEANQLAGTRGTAKTDQVSVTTPEGTPAEPAYDVSQDPMLPPPPRPRGHLQLLPIGGYLHGTDLATSAAEIVAYDVDSRRLFVVNSEQRSIDILDIADPVNPTLFGRADMGEFGLPNSVAVRNGMIATCIASTSKSETGKVVFLSADGERLSVLDVGHEPDMLTFSPDGRWLLVANEGEPVADYSFDAEGSISQIDLAEGVASLTQAHVATLDFLEFNDQQESLDPSIRIFGKNASVAQDLEPEYITVSADSKTAWIVCQENNAIAIADLESKQVTRLVGLGFKDHSLKGNWLDASDKDGKIRIRPWPLKGIYQPDGITSYVVDGQTYLVTANEGDARDHSGFSEECRVADLKLDPAVFPNAAELQKKEHLGRLQVTNATGDRNGDGLFEEIHSYGARSFSIWNADAQLIYDSGDEFERFLADHNPEFFNSDHESHNFDDRSDNKGPEPEGVVVGEVADVLYAFILLERDSGVLVYDISNPAAPVFENYVNTRDCGSPPAAGSGGDLGPEGAVFIPENNSPNGQPLLVVSYEVSGTTRIFEISVPQTEPVGP